MTEQPTDLDRKTCDAVAELHRKPEAQTALEAIQDVTFDPRVHSIVTAYFDEIEGL